MVEESKSLINLGVVLNDKGEVLVIRRVKEEITKDGKVLKWTFPGGKQKLNELRSESIKREIFNETGYKVRTEKEISMRMPPELPIILVYHLCRLEEPNQVQPSSKPWEIAEIKWVKPRDLKTLFTTSLDPKVAQELKIA